ncbi:MAG: glycine cleavage system aminomethyltransferase GcvT [Chitinophagales bacterium]|nr:glycine cleavage system aminomethyltransferase GcvT [Chitinophagales bacterium]MDW8419561.1 glycine cleavage system aminomethyltransferase GcvT [Chitinophagales bacterium]
MKQTALTPVHQALGAKMAEFAGYFMPIVYSGINEEHRAVRERVGVFDVSHMGEFILRGTHALDLVQWITTNDASKLTDGKVQYSCMTNLQGGIVDDLLVYRLSEREYMLVVNAANIAKDWDWIKQHNTYGVEMINRSDELSLLAVQGPQATKALQKITDVPLSEIPYYAFRWGEMAGIPDILISNTGYTGAGGFELYVPNAHARKLWDAVFEAGEEFGIMPCGLGSRDTLRLEKAYCLYGNDIDDTTSPIEAGLGWITKFTKSFVHSEYHRALKDNGPQRKLVGFEINEKGRIARQHYLIKNELGEEIGKVTSGTQSPTLQKAIGLGYVKTPYSAPGTEIFVEIRGAITKATVVKTPFL